MTTLEALAYFTPAIVTDCGGPAEIIEDGISGKLVPVGNISAMAEAIVELANDPQRRQSFSINGRKQFEEKFNLEKQANKLAAVYNSLLSIATSPQKHESPKSAS
jgi:glycosyltransferase involved in cell wall biosynthesis